MTTFQLVAIRYPKGSASSCQVEVILRDAGQFTVRDAESENDYRIGECTVSEPLGKAARHITLPDGARLEIADGNALQQWESTQGQRRVFHLVARMEDNGWLVSLLALVLILFLALGYFVILPWACVPLSAKIPKPLVTSVSRQAHDLIVKLLDFSPSKVSKQRRNALRDEFKLMVKELDPDSGLNYQLHFHASLIPNAMALPDGSILLTDALVRLARSDQEILCVLAHEIAHVRQRHGLRKALQGSALILVWGLVTGDASSWSGFGVALPAGLAEARYSRSFETEADSVAGSYAIKRGWGVEPLCALFERLSQRGADSGLSPWLSSHPVMLQRIESLRRLASAASAPGR